MNENVAHAGTTKHIFQTGAEPHHGKTAILDFLLSICGGVQTKRVKWELAH